MTYEELKSSEHVLFESIRGSHLFGLNTETSDIDTFGLFCCPIEWLLAPRSQRKEENLYQSHFTDEKNDNYYDELEKFINELKKSNPEALTALYTPEDKILKWNPVLQPLWDIRDSLLTKASYPSFRGYAKSQISKMYGLSKAMNIDPEEVRVRKSPLYFCWVPRPGNTGAWTLEKWLRENGLKQQHAGVVRIPNGVEMYQLYYDYFADKDLKVEDYARLRYNDPDHPEKYREELEEGKKTTMIKYRGVIDPTSPDTTQLRSSSIPKSEAHECLCIFQYNTSAYSAHCSDYAKYHKWLRERNQQRYADNYGHQYDAKNSSHAIRIMRMGIELAQGKGIILDRRVTGDRDFLLDVKKHKLSFEEVKKVILETENEMKEAFEKSNLPEEPDTKLLDDVLIGIRKNYYGF